MPADVGGEWIGDLCNHHRQVVRNLEHLDHVDDRESVRVAAEMIRQCCGRNNA